MNSLYNYCQKSSDEIGKAMRDFFLIETDSQHGRYSTLNSIQSTNLMLWAKEKLTWALAF